MEELVLRQNPTGIMVAVEHNGHPERKVLLSTPHGDEWITPDHASELAVALNDAAMAADD